MGVFGNSGGINGEQAAQRLKIIASIPQETDMLKLAKYVALDQVDYNFDPCGKSWHTVNPDLTDMSRLAIARMNALMGFEDVIA